VASAVLEAPAVSGFSTLVATEEAAVSAAPVALAASARVFSTGTSCPWAARAPQVMAAMAVLGAWAAMVARHSHSMPAAVDRAATAATPATAALASTHCSAGVLLATAGLAEPAGLAELADGLSSVTVEPVEPVVTVGLAAPAATPSNRSSGEQITVLRN
jgi:hypothetical protein